MEHVNKEYVPPFCLALFAMRKQIGINRWLSTDKMPEKCDLLQSPQTQLLDLSVPLLNNPASFIFCSIDVNKRHL